LKRKNYEDERNI